MMNRRTSLALAPLLAIFLYAVPASATEKNTRHLRCHPTETAALQCTWRGAPKSKDTPTTPGIRITATAGTTALPVSPVTPFPQTGETVAFLFLVDTSNPARWDTVKKNGEDIRALLVHGKPHHRFGLATFDSELTVLTPLGAKREDVATALPRMTAKGRTTEFYRTVEQGVKLLADFRGERKAMLIFSDGKAEDEAYSHADVVRAALAAEVVIYGLGIAETVAHSPALQRLRRLAEETGGTFNMADDSKHLPAEFLYDIPALMDGGGSFTVDLTALHGEQEVSVQVRTTDGGEGFHRLTVHRPHPTSVSPAPPPSAAASPPPPPPWHETYRLHLLAGGGGFLLLILLLFSRNKETVAKGKPVAFLEDEAGHVYTIYTPHVRIGRHTANDIHLDDDSISGYHAEMHIGRDGNFQINDLGATNGVWINGEKKNSHLLQEGDLLELGDVRLHFRWARKS